MKARRPFGRAAASMIVAGMLLAGTAGCTFVTPQATQISYNPGNGAAANLGGVDVRNAVGVASDDGERISLVITLVNATARGVAVTLQYNADGERRTQQVSVPARASVGFGNTPDEDQLVVNDSGVEAGDLLALYAQFGDKEGKTLMVPVLPANGIYDELGPATPSPTPTPTTPPPAEDETPQPDVPPATN